MRCQTILAGVAALATLAAGSAASAAIVQVTLTGNSENINDATGVFGPAGSRITNEQFTETFLINTTVGTFGSATATSASYNSIFGAPGPYAVAASLTINGHTFSTQGDDYSSVFITPGSGVTPTDYQLVSDDLVTGLPESQFNQIFSLELDGANLPVTLTQTGQLTGTGSSSTSPYVLQTSGGPVTVRDGFIDGLEDSHGNTLVDSQGELYPTTITFGAVPEPSTWALMLAGVGGVGLMMRRARKTLGSPANDVFAA
jgi:hypothetical protein